MIAQARVAVPEATFIELDLLGSWAALDGRRFSRIVATYVFHECDLRTKVQMLQELARGHLDVDGRIVIGDTAFATTRQLEQERSRSGADWDPAEHYRVASEALAALAVAGIDGTFQPVSTCAGVFFLRAISTP